MSGSSPPEHDCTLEERVAFLQCPESYPSQPERVEAIETHMAWVFLTNLHAWKLKKPVKTEYLDFSTVAARQRDCSEEVRLNRRLAPDVYLGHVPLTQTSTGQLQLGGDGPAVDWLVQMHRLPRDRMLDAMIEQCAILKPHLRRAAELLTRFYQRSQPIRWAGDAYRQRLIESVRANQHDLDDRQFQLASDNIEQLAAAQLKFLDQEAALFNGRVRAGKLVEAHGDLRPEHVCLTEPPAIIDCLEFNRGLRILDTASELSFLALECERLGAEWVGPLFFETYARLTGDRPSSGLVRFYQSWHACTRAKIALWHLRDDGPQPEKWHRKADWYLSVAHSCLQGDPGTPKTR